MNTPAASLQRRCPGLPAEWVNGWLAAVGATVLDPQLELHWSTGPSPVAVMRHPLLDPAEAIAAAWPDTTRIAEMPLAANRAGCITLNKNDKRSVAVEAFTERVSATRGHRDAWTLTSTITDLETHNGAVNHGPFDAAGPGTIKWLHHRLTKVHAHTPNTLPELVKAVSETLDGISLPSPNENGLGFDFYRIPDRARHGISNQTHPLVEVLAFFGLALLPVRGDGIRRPEFHRARQRGHDIATNRGFLWPAWSQPLNRYAIDALLDQWHRTWLNPQQHHRRTAATWRQLGIHAAWRTTPYQPASSSDNTRGFNSELVTARS